MQVVLWKLSGKIATFGYSSVAHLSMEAHLFESAADVIYNDVTGPDMLLQLAEEL